MFNVHPWSDSTEFRRIGQGSSFCYTTCKFFLFDGIALQNPVPKGKPVTEQHYGDVVLKKCPNNTARNDIQ